jgi:hypothetical protein
MPNELEPRFGDAGRGLEKTRDLLLAASQRAGGRGDWGLARRLVDLAERADTLRREIQELAGTRPPEPAPQAPREEPTPRAKKHGSYPKFSIRGGVLVKAGLGRDKRTIYEHTVPRDKYDQILARLAAMAGGDYSRGEFAIDEVHNEVDCPVYMTYAMVSLLQQEGLLSRERKGAYRFVAPEQFASRASGIWERLG